MKTQNTTSLSVRAKELALPIVFPLWPAFTGLFDRLSVVRATGIILGLLVCGLSAYSQSPGLGGQTQFESVSVVVPAGNACVLHPDGSLDPKQSIRLRADADGVVRFQAVRPTHPNSVDRLALDCTDSYGNNKTYSVDLRSEETFERRPFDPVSANLAFRPALSGDPLSFTQQELIQAGYGLRPDPAANPGGYQRWLAAVSAPAYKLPSAARTPSTLPEETSRTSFLPSVRGPEPDSDETISPVPSGRSNAGWTGAVLSGSYKKNATSALTYSYVENEASFVVPTMIPGGYDTGGTLMSIWNGLDTSALFQAIVWVNETTQSYFIHRQDFASNNPASTYDGEGINFTPNAGDLIYTQVWYCDAKGNVNLSGGYGCSVMFDVTQGVEWECDQAKSSECQSFTTNPADLTNGKIGQTAEFIIEGDTDEVTGNCPKATSSTQCYDEWPDFSPVTMSGAAFVVQGSGVSGTGTWVTTNTDPSVTLLTDDVTSIPFERGDGHLLITLPEGEVKWKEQQTNIYYWNGSNFNSLSTPQGTPAAQPGVIFGCATSIGVGPNSRGLTNGTPWSTACNAHADGNYDVNQMQTGGASVEMQADIATQVAVSPEGHAWAINAKGDILYWNGSKFVANPTGGCATSITVGPSSYGLSNGTPWITGCKDYPDGNRDVYQMQTGGAWVKIQTDIAYQISVSPEGSITWALNLGGNILASVEDGVFIDVSAGLFYPGSNIPLCATSIAAGPSATPWFTGCLYADGNVDGNYPVYELQLDGTVSEMQADGGTHVAMSPAGNAWTISTLK